MILNKKVIKLLILTFSFIDFSLPLKSTLKMIIVFNKKNIYNIG